MDNSNTRNSINRKRELHGKHYVNKKRTKTVNSINTMPQSEACICGGGQSCIVDRRWVGDWVHEDQVFTNKSLPLRDNCYQQYNTEQLNALKESLNNN